MMSGSSRSSILTSIDMPGKFNTSRIIQAKSPPTTQLTTSDTNWEGIFDIMIPLNSKTNSNATRGDSVSSSNDGNRAKRSLGLLTPHPSIGGNVTEKDFKTAKSNLPSTPYVDDDSQLGEITFANTEDWIRIDRESDLPTTPKARTSVSNASSSGSISFASVGVQTSLPYTSSSCMSTPLPSPTAFLRSPYATPKPSPKRKRESVPEYIREGEAQARELEDDLVYLAQEKRRLKRCLSRIERSERELKGLLIPCSAAIDDSAETESDTESESVVARSPCFRSRAPLTPASSECEIKADTLTNLAQELPPVSTIPSSSSQSTFTSTSTYVSATSRLFGATAPDSCRSGRLSANATLQVPEYTFGEGSSTTSGNDSNGEDSQRAYEEAHGLAPNPILDPLTYLIWFDMETTDVARPAAKIRILEVAMLITDKNYRRLDKGKSFLVHWPLSADEIARDMPQRVREMHAKSGLLSAYASTPPEERLILSQVERRLCRYLERHDVQPTGRGIMAGAGIAFDRGMVRQHMPKLDAYFGHQIFDTTTLWHFIRRKYNRTKRFSVACAHRALDDILESSREAKLYSELVLKATKDVHWSTQSSRGI